MDTNSQLEMLIKRTEDFGKSTIQLIFLQTIDKLAHYISSIAVYVIIALVGLIFILFASVAFAFWMGNCLGSVFYGFAIVALIYASLTLLIYLVRDRWIKVPFNNSLIRLFQNK